MSVIKMCKLVLMFAVIIAIEGCSTVPKCSDPASIQLIEDIFYDQFKVPEETKSTMRKYLKLNLTAARLTSVDEKIGKNSCSGTLSIAFEPEKLGSLADRFVFNSRIVKVLGYPRATASFELQDYRADIHYDIQNTEKDGLYGSVLGLTELVAKVDLLVIEGVFNNNKETSLKKIGISLHNNEMFFDANNILVFEDYTQMLHMINWNEHSDNSDYKASQVEVNHFYCKTDGKFKIINRQYYSEHNGKGYVTSGKHDFEDVFYTVEPTTQFEYLWEVACGKKLTFSEAEIQQSPSPPIEPKDSMPIEPKSEDLPSAARESDDLKAYAETIAKELVPSAEQKPDANVKRNLETGGNGIFEIYNLEEKSATFTFKGWASNPNSKRRQYIYVEAQPGQDVRLVMIEKMISLIGEHYKGDFNWDSHRLNRTIVMSARPEDNAKLEEFMMIEFFGENYKTELPESVPNKNSSETRDLSTAAEEPEKYF